jgi:hypothetical protein
VNVVKKVMDLHYDEIDKSYRKEASNLMHNVPFGKAALFLNVTHTYHSPYFKNKNRNVLEIQLSVSKRLVCAYCMYITQFSSETFTIISSGYGGKADLEGRRKGRGRGREWTPFVYSGL